MYNYVPKSEKLIKGQILSGLNKACHFFYPETWNQFNIRISELPGQVGAFINEIKTLVKQLTPLATDLDYIKNELKKLKNKDMPEIDLSGIESKLDNLSNSINTFEERLNKLEKKNTGGRF